MAKRLATTAGQSKSGRSRKVLHVSDFQDLYELADDVRKERSGPLRYTKSLVTLSPFCPDAESRHFERMIRLKARPERHLLRSIFEDLKNWTGSKPYGPRGYLVTAEGKAASSEYLAEQLGVSVDEIEKALPTLEQLGFLERIQMDGQAEPKPKRPRTRGKTGDAKTAKKTTKQSEQKNNQKAQNIEKHTPEASIKEVPESAGLSRTEPESVCPPSRKDKDKAKGKSKVKDNQKATIGLTVSGCKSNNNGNGISVETKVNMQNKSKDEPLPSEPQESEALGGIPSQDECKSPQGSVKSNRGQYGDTWPISEAVYDNNDMIYGRRIYLALGYNGDVDSIEARREITSFASKWHECRQLLNGLSPPEIDRLGVRGLTEAAKIAKRKTNRNKGAVWNDLMNKLVAAQRSPP